MAKISPQNIAEAVYQVTEAKSGGVLENTMKSTAKMLHRKRMLGRSEEILYALQDIVDKKEGIVRVKVITAKSLDNNEKNKLEEEIREKYKAKKVISEYFEKRELLGGMRVEVGTEVLDTTYKSRLQKLEEFLIKK